MQLKHLLIEHKLDSVCSHLFGRYYLAMMGVFCCALLTLFSTNSISAEGGECDQGAYCIEPNSWQLGIALGLGGRTNPLVDGDDIPFIVLPDIAYYGESFYFDNFELGLQFYPSQASSVEVFIAPNTEKANFSFWQPSNIFIPASSFADTGMNDSEIPLDVDVSIDDIESRDLAIDGGVRWQWYKPQHHIRVTLSGDISGVYDGLHGSLEYRYSREFERWRWSISPHFKWYSQNLTDYYYGIRSEDTSILELTYQADGGLQYGVNVSMAYSIDENWQWLGRASYTQLHSGMRNSPLVEDDKIVSAFVGIAYRF